MHEVRISARPLESLAKVLTVERVQQQMWKGRVVLGDEALAGRLGRSAHERVRDNFLVDVGLEHWAHLLGALVT